MLKNVGNLRPNVKLTGSPASGESVLNDGLAADKLDAERYRWLLAHGAPMGVIDWGLMGLNNQDTEGLSEAIDAAITEAANVYSAPEKPCNHNEQK